MFWRFPRQPSDFAGHVAIAACECRKSSHQSSHQIPIPLHLYWVDDQAIKALLGFWVQVLSWIDICAGLAAKTVARGPCVTASVDSVHFIRPVRKGSVAIIAAMVNRTFTSSMEVGVGTSCLDMNVFWLVAVKCLAYP